MLITTPTFFLIADLNEEVITPTQIDIQENIIPLEMTGAESSSSFIVPKFPMNICMILIYLCNKIY